MGALSFLRAPLTGSRTGYYFILHHLSCFYFGLSSSYQPASSLGMTIRPRQEKGRQLLTVSRVVYSFARLCVCALDK